jgi:hypothetical protein
LGHRVLSEEGDQWKLHVELTNDSCVTKMLEEFEPYLAKNRTYVTPHGLDDVEPPVKML